MATLAHNLDVIRSIVQHCYPGIEVGWIGNAAHQAEQSDHNPDARGIVHADDLMFLDDVKFHHGAPATLAWLLTPEVRASLQYVIHDRGIWSVGSGWERRNYDQPGSDPHTNHIHVSGKHGLVGKNDATGTGYNTAAEHMTPAGTPCATAVHPTVPVQAPTEEDELSSIMVKVPAGYSDAGKQIPIEDAISSLMNYMLQDRNNSLAALKALQGLIDTAPASGTVDVATIKAALASVLNDATLDVSVPAAG